MNFKHSQLNRYFAVFTFLYSFIIYLLTLAPTASFWDPGEFIAVANRLQVTHPPGAPFFLLLGRLFSMFASPENVAYWVNMVSALASAFTIMFLYLIIIRLIREFKPHPDELSLFDKISLYGSGLIGSLLFAVSDTFWFSAVEAEVYAVSMFFTSAVVWMALKWAEHADDEDNERWLILISYMFGLALGVHLLNVLALYFIALIYYFKKYEFGWKSFLIMGVISSFCFVLIYPITVINLASIAGAIGPMTSYLINAGTFAFLFIVALIFGIWYTHTHKMRLLNIAVISYTVIIIGFSSYALVMIRSIADPPIDENDPETIEAFVSYIKRDQYGSTPIFSGSTFDNSTGNIDRSTKKLFPRRWSGEPRHLNKYAEFSSDFDYFVKYQIEHMYIRYFNWNFIGRESDIQDTGWTGGFSESMYEDNPAHNVFFYFPFLLGLLGLIYHYQCDWKRAFAVTALFLMTGVAIIIFLNQYPFQPRERDYAYVGSFFAFVIWVGIGFTALLDILSDLIKKKPTILAVALFPAVLLGGPIWMLSQNFDDHDRSERYVAPDYAYNLLNSVAPYGIIFTNGDNDTFPLWYLQEVERIRTDVRVVCLSLINTPWYINQMKNQWSHESPPLQFSYTDEQIRNIEDKFKFEKPSDFHRPQTYRIPVNKENMATNFYGKSNEHDRLSIKMEANDLDFEVTSPSMKFDFDLDALDDTISFYYKGISLGRDRADNEVHYSRVQDDMIIDLIRNNIDKRPIYFAVTVSRDSQLNLQNYFYLEGQAYRVVPKRHNDKSGKILTERHGERLSRFKFREVNNPDAYFDENIRRMLDNYRELISNQAVAYISKNNLDSAAYWLKWGEEKIPFTTVEGDPSSIVRYGYKYLQAGMADEAVRLANSAKTGLEKPLKRAVDEVDRIETRLIELQGKIQSARRSADLKKANTLQSEAMTLDSQRESTIREVYFVASRIFLIQRIYFDAGMENEAVELGNWANDLSRNRIGFATTREENRQQTERMIF